MSVRKLLAVASVPLLAIGMAAGWASSASAAPSGKTYVKAVPMCKNAKPGHATCYGLRRVVVSKGTPGAHVMSSAHPAYTTGLAGGFTPKDLATAYGVDPTAATTMTVAIVDAFDDPNALADLKKFDSHYGLATETATSFKKVSQTGSTTALPPSDSGWAGEETLDLDAVRGLCNQCKIILVEANSNSFADLATAENEAVTLGAKVISNSYGGAESGTIPASIKAAYNHSGVVITASTADHGMYDWDNFNEGGGSSDAPATPSSLNTVVAVGGTTLYLNPDATRSAETVWNENGSSDVAGFNLNFSMGASGGGCSTQVTAQTWQKNVANYSQTTCGTKRLAGDISALADPYTGYDIYDTFNSGGWQTIGGTSLASPLIAALWALAGGSGGVAYPAKSLYQHFAADGGSSLYDVTAGGNGLCDATPAASCQALTTGTPPNASGFGTMDCAWKRDSATLNTGTRECDAAPGYDGPSGVGTPIGLAAFSPVA